MTIVTPDSAIVEHIPFAPFVTKCAIPSEAVDSIWESNFLADWTSDMPLPQAPSLRLAEILARCQSSLRALGAVVVDAAWQVAFAATVIEPGLEGLAHNVMLCEDARAEVAKRNPGLVAARQVALDLLAGNVSDPSEIADALVAARCGVAVSAEIRSGSPVGDALVARLVAATGAASSRNAREVRAALVAAGDHDALLLSAATAERGVIDIDELPALAALVTSGVLDRAAIRARAHADGAPLARRLGLVELAPVRVKEAMTKEAEDVLAQFEVFMLLDPTPAARRAIRWWPSLEDADIQRILDVADIETVVDWCSGAMQFAPEAEAIVELLNRMSGPRFDEFCAEVGRRPDPTEEQPAFAVALRDPMKQPWRPAGAHAAVQLLTEQLSEPRHWHTAVALLANGWQASIWELAHCARQV